MEIYGVQWDDNWIATLRRMTPDMLRVALKHFQDGAAKRGEHDARYGLLQIAGSIELEIKSRGGESPSP